MATNNAAYFSFCGDVKQARVEAFTRTFVATMEGKSRLNGPPDHAYILFHSRGGENRPGLELHEFLAKRAGGITVINIGYVCSAALIMFLAVPRERRLMAEHAVFMAHDVFTVIDGDATAEELADFAATREIESRQVRDIVCHETHITTAEWDCAAQLELEIWRDRKNAAESGIVSRVGGLFLPHNVHIIEL